jgi:hypothetical protein
VKLIRDAIRAEDKRLRAKVRVVRVHMCMCVCLCVSSSWTCGIGGMEPTRAACTGDSSPNTAKHTP